MRLFSYVRLMHAAHILFWLTPNFCVRDSILPILLLSFPLLLTQNPITMKG